MGAFTIGYLREVEASLGGGNACADKDTAEPEAAAAEVPQEAAEVGLPAKEAAAVANATHKKASVEVPVRSPTP